MTDIDKKVLEQAAGDIRQRLMDYASAIERAYIKCEDPVFVITLGVKFSEERDGLKIETPISFTSEKIKDKGISYYDENKKPKQMQLSEIDDKRREILFRDFSELRERLGWLHKKFMFRYYSEFGTRERKQLFKSFSLAA